MPSEPPAAVLANASRDVREVQDQIELSLFALLQGQPAANLKKYARRAIAALDAAKRSLRSLS